MAITQVQKKSAGGQNTATVTLDSTPTVGNVMIATYFTRAAAAGPPTGWTQAVLVNNATESDQLSIYYRVVQSGDGTAYVWGADSDSEVATIFEYSGLDTSSPLDKTASTGRTTAVSSLSAGTTATTTQNDELSIAAVGLRTGSATGPSWSASFTQEASQTGGTTAGQLISGSHIETATGAITSTCSWTGSFTAMGVIATFKAAAAGGDPEGGLIGGKLLGGLLTTGVLIR